MSKPDRHGLWDRLRCEVDVRQFLTYLGVGLAGTAGHYLVLVVLVRLAHLEAVPASACGFCVGAVINYFANYNLTFRSCKHHGRAMSQFFAIALGGLAVNTGAMALLTRSFSMHYLIAQVLATGIVVVLTYLGNRYWTFREVEIG